ncbi:30S ribosomal protein S24e [Nanoarchaeota archaeon]
MKLEIKNQKDNKLLHRKEVEGLLTYEGATPSNVQVQKEVAAQLKVDEKLVVVRHIYNQYGENTADVLAYAYDNEDSMKRIEFIKEEAKPAEEKKAEAAPAAEAPKEAPKPEAPPAEEKPAEEKKEEAPAEEKKE